MLTVEKLKAMQPETIFASGEFLDNDLGINFQGTGKQLKWVAVRGGIHDWAIYCHYAEYPNDYIARSGDKIHNLESVKQLVACDEESLAWYRQ